MIRRAISLMKSQYLIIAALLTAMLLGFLFQKSQSNDTTSHNVMINSFSMVTRLSMITEKNVLLASNGYTQDYDSLVESLVGLNSFNKRLREKLPLDSNEVAMAWSAYLQLVKNKEKIIEDFKSHNALLKNSLNLFSYSIELFSREIDSINSSSNIKQLGETSQSINQLFQHIVLYSFNRQLEYKNKALTLIRKLKEPKDLDKSLLSTIKDILLHADLVLFYKDEVDELVSNALSIKIDAAVYYLRESYLETYSQSQRQVNIYRFILIAVSSLFAAMVFFVLFRLTNARKTLEDTIKDLHFHKFAMDQHAIISTTDVKGKISYVNERFSQISGYSKEELIDQNHCIVKSDAHNKEFFKSMWSVIANGEVWQGEIKNLSKSGRGYWVSSTIVPFLNEAGKPFQYISIGTDITERKHAERELKKEKEFLSRLTGAIGQGIYVLDEMGLCRFMNPEAEKLLGWSFADLNGRDIHDYIHYETEDGESVSKDECAIADEISKSKTYRSESEIFFHKDGHSFPVSVVSVPLISDDVLIGSVSVFSDITENKNKEIELLEAKNDALKASRAKSEFLSNMSHELRTPMNAILGFSQLLETDPNVNEDQLDFISEINKAGKHLLELINEILDLAKIESGKIDVSIDSVEVFDLIYECMALVDPLAEKTNIKLTFDPDEDNPLNVLADRTRLKQIIINLLSNGIKYNRPEGEVVITVFLSHDEMVRINIQDSGYGIPEDKQNDLFQPFSRVTDNESEIEGTGIGLIFSRSMAEMMSGKLSYESVIGEGSNFWVEMPIADSERQIKQVVELPQLKRSSNSGISNKTVLYVEDNPANLRLVENIFSKLDGIDLHTASLPSIGLEMAPKVMPDLFLLDINMPEMTGYELMDELRKNPVFLDTPILAVSANAMQSDIKKGLENGFSEYLTKPIDVPEFIKKMHLYLAD